MKPEIRFEGYDQEWRKEKLNSLCNYNASCLSIGDAVEDGMYPLYDANAIIGYVDFFFMNNDYITIIKDGSGVGRIRKLPKHTAFIGTMGALTTKNDELDFLFYLLAYLDLGKQYSGSSIPHIYFKEYGNLFVYTPEKTEQRNIGLCFNYLDKLIDTYQQKYESLLKVKKSMLEKMFPKEGVEIPEIRFAGYTYAWEQYKLGDVADRVTRKNTNLESDLPLTISAQHGLIDQNQFFNKRIASKDVSGYFLLKNGEFAYNKSTSSDAPWGAIKRLDNYDKGVLSTLYIVFSLKRDENIDSDFLVSYYDTECWHKGVQEIAAEGARNHGLLNIAPADFFDTKLRIPRNISEQQQIGNLFRLLDRLISLHQRKCIQLQNVKRAMLQKMFV